MTICSFKFGWMWDNKFSSFSLTKMGSKSPFFLLNVGKQFSHVLINGSPDLSFYGTFFSSAASDHHSSNYNIVVIVVSLVSSLF